MSEVLAGPADLSDNGTTMTALSCLALGAAFLAAIGLLVFAGVTLGWIFPDLLARWKGRSGGPPPNRD